MPINNHWLKALLHSISNEPSIIYLVLFTVLSGLSPHPANVAPYAALGLFAGTYVRNPFLLLSPLLAVALTDALGSGFYDLRVLLFVYSGHLSASLFGRGLVRGAKLRSALPLATLAASLSFYFLSNFGTWLAFYPQSLQGLLDCYLAGLPYLAKTLLGNGLYVMVFFVPYEYIRKYRGNTSSETRIT